MLYGDFVLDISFLQTILFALFAILTLFQGRLFTKHPQKMFLPLFLLFKETFMLKHILKKYISILLYL
ncbi:Uncharacterized protein XB16_2332 [Leptospira santarosai]|uniref:Uncharacterized protein n=1 Tax=Leptospira santarosai TaxID=28183 RepID=A0A2P1QUR5_9LEPT|nr:Uncharacterized protein XB16_2332 [Leptospira santarosai]